MNTPAESFWSPIIRPEVLSPRAILEQQAVALKEQTKGILVGEVTKQFSGNKEQLHLDIIAPVLNQYRHRVLTVEYKADTPYPLSVLIPPLQQPADSATSALFPGAAQIQDWSQRLPLKADNDEGFREILRQILNMPDLASTAASLIARSVEKLEEGNKKPN